MTRQRQNTSTDQARLDKIAAKERELAEAKEELSKITGILRCKTVETVQKQLALFSHGAPITAAMDTSEARNVVMGYLIEAGAIPLHLDLCKMLEQVGFDSSAITYGEFEGAAVGFAAGLPLLKFVGFIAEDAPTLKEASLLMSLDDGDTKH